MQKTLEKTTSGKSSLYASLSRAVPGRSAQGISRAHEVIGPRVIQPSPLSGMNAGIYPDQINHIKYRVYKPQATAINDALSSTRVDNIIRELKSLINEDLRGAQEVFEKTQPLLMEHLKQADVRDYRRFLKKQRQMISGDAYTATPADNSRVEDLAIMKNNPIWPEIVKRIENQSE